MKPTDAQFQAILGCSNEADGAFWYGVATTGIYCRPSCRSKAPRRENLRIFTAPAEAEALAAAGIPFEIVPGISSALAVPAYAGIPLTHRDHSSSVTVLTGARANDGEFKRNLLLSSAADTLVILMGVRHLREIVADLVGAGRSGETPVAVIRWGSYEGQQTVCGTIDSIADAAAQSEMRAPAVIVIGEVVKLRERLQWFESAVKSSLWEELELVGSA